MMIKQLEIAFVESKPIEIIYLKKDNSVSQRFILVHGVTETYIKAYCLENSRESLKLIPSYLLSSKESRGNYWMHKQLLNEELKKL